ncbi:MAG: SUMF1/EgtB/PvdO family nonheme iron enzyme, partial [Planctomycetota bacterium]
RGRIAEERAIRIARTSDGDRLDRALREARLLWPATPARVPDMDDWLEDLGESLESNLELHRAALEDLRARALPYTPEDAERDLEQHPEQTRLAAAREELIRIEEILSGARPAPPGAEAETRETYEGNRASLMEFVAEWEQVVAERTTWAYHDPELQEEHDDLAKLVERLEQFTDPDTGTLAEVRERRRAALAVYRDTVEDSEAAARWKAARQAITANPRYRGLDLTPQVGLVPLAEDPHSGLWEFWHTDSGSEPERPSDPGAFNPWAIDAESGVVLTLIPGGSYRIGAQAEDPAAPHYDPDAKALEGPVREVELEPFFLSKYEMTQAQYQRITGANPSGYKANFFWSGDPEQDEPVHSNEAWNPVEYDSWQNVTWAMTKTNLRLPTLEEWEVGARGGQGTPWWTGMDRALMGDAGFGLPIGNLGDELTRARGGPDYYSVNTWSDEFCIHAPVGNFPPNPYGLFDVFGNVAEMCSDYGIEFAGDNVIAACGGTYQSDAVDARVTARGYQYDIDQSNQVGFRPARSVE